MKKVRILTCALAALMLGACSNEEIVKVGGVVEPQWSSDGKGYINLAIQLPTQPSTRASDSNNDNFDDGTPAEYDVKDATLILFTGETAQDGTLTDDQLNVNSAYDLNLNFYSEGSKDDQITTTTKITQEINKISATTEGNKLVIRALVVLNNNGLFSVEGNQLKVNNASFNGSLSTLNTNLQATLGEKAIANTSSNGAGLLMANAVMADKAGGLNTLPANVAKVGPLVDINPGMIFSTKAEAEANPAASIYVERAVAKVTVSAKDGNLSEGENEANKLSYTIVGWALDNTNTTSKLVRTGEGFAEWNNYASAYTSTTPNYRMIGGTPVAANLFRTYWDKDCNYSTAESATTGLATVGGSNATIDKGLIVADGETPGYCYENTTDLSSMTERNLTRVILKVEFNDGNAFYVIDDERDTIWVEEDVKAEVAARLLKQGPNTLYDWAKANINGTLSSTDLTITLSDETAGKRTVAGVALNASGEGKLKDPHTAFPADEAKAMANDLIELHYYADGISYYPVYIKHFGDDLTPWSEPTPGAPTYDSAENFLGRYGVLRNNWYAINVTGIKGLGEPNVTEVTNKPVDEVSYYISVNINVLSWAKRTQDVEL